LFSAQAEQFGIPIDQVSGGLYRIRIYHHLYKCVRFA
jgi:hypothetical protein